MSNTLVDKVREAGVVGAGGAGFPTHVKLSAKAEFLIANGTECEPLLRADQHLMASQAPSILEGMRLAMEAIGATQGIIAIKRGYRDAIAAFERAMSRYPSIRFQLFESFYPAGDEHVVVHDCTGRTVPEGGIPIEVGIVVQNVASLHNIAQAAKGIPVTERLMTVAGEVNQPATLLVPVGTAYSEVLREVGGYRQARFGGYSLEDLTLVEGGPMMGRLVSEDDIVTKTTGGLLVLPKGGAVVTHLSRDMNTIVRRGKSACDQCRDCTELCPRFLLGHELEPHRVMRNINYGLDLPARTVTAAILCCECRLCEAFACPLELSPYRYYKSIKEALRAEGWRNELHRNPNPQPHSVREYRRVPSSRLMDRLGLSDYKDQQAPLRTALMHATEVRIPLRMHIGAPSVPVVQKGQRVERGELIAALPEGKLGANIHASINGVVEAVTQDHIRIVRST